jgi:predicted GIY-YIG superfamily endonuclease
MSTTIYVLRLEGGRYYVGKTDNLERRQQEHFNGTASAWTKKYKPVAVERIFRNASPFDEDKWTKEYMSKHGIDNVRGGAYCQINLDESQIESINRETRGAKDLCSQCGRAGHFAKNCYAKTEASGSKIHHEEPSTIKKSTCYRCGREGHYSPDCYAKTDSNGYTLDSDDDDDDDESDDDEDDDDGYDS